MRYIELTEEIILSQEDQPGAHPAPADIARESKIDRWLVSCVIDQDPRFRFPKKHKD